MTIGDKIRYLRLGRRWSVQKLADRTGIHRVQLTYYECETRVPGIFYLQKISKALHVSMRVFQDCNPPKAVDQPPEPLSTNLT